LEPPVYILLIVVYFFIQLKFKRFIGHRNILGRRVTVVYHDKNVEFDTIFPKDGLVTNKIEVGSSTCFILKFDTPFLYKRKSYDTIVIKERNFMQALGRTPLTDIQVSLPKTAFDIKNKYSIRDFDNVAWARVKLSK
jgi:hypothetical protein